jgi:hypothetical protein
MEDVLILDVDDKLEEALLPDNELAVEGAGAGVFDIAVDNAGEGVAVTMVVTCCVDVGTPMVAGKVSIVEVVAEVEVPMMVAVIVPTVSG